MFQPRDVNRSVQLTMETILLAIQGARNKYNAHLNRDVNNENRSVDVYSSEINIVQHHSLCRKAVHQLRLSEINERAALLFRAIDAHVNVIGATSTIESHIAVASAAAALLPERRPSGEELLMTLKQPRPFGAGLLATSSRLTLPEQTCR